MISWMGHLLLAVERTPCDHGPRDVPAFERVTSWLREPTLSLINLFFCSCAAKCKL